MRTEKKNEKKRTLIEISVYTLAHKRLYAISLYREGARRNTPERYHHKGSNTGIFFFFFYGGRGGGEENRNEKRVVHAERRVKAKNYEKCQRR